MVLNPLLVFLFFMSVRMFSYNTPEGKEHIIHNAIFLQAVKISSMLILFLLVPLLLLFRYFISRTYVTYTSRFFLIYSIINISIPVVILVWQYVFLRKESWWIKEYIIICACLTELFYAFTTFLIAKNFFLYIEYFLFPIIRLSLLIIVCMFVIRKVHSVFLVGFSIIIFIAGVFSVSSAVVANIERMLFGIIVVVLCIFTVVQISTYKRYQSLYA